jgi:hypothetical protein
MQDGEQRCVRAARRGVAYPPRYDATGHAPAELCAGGVRVAKVDEAFRRRQEMAGEADVI